MTSDPLLESEHFTLHELAAGVWAAIATPGGLASSNSGIVDLGDQTLVFDTTVSGASSADLRAAAERLTRRPVTVVLNSHWHRDHVFGNSVFSPETNIYATARTREIMVEKTADDMAAFKKEWCEHLERWPASARAATDEAERKDFEDGVRFARSVVAAFPQMAVRLPEHTFADRLEFKGTQRNIELISFGGGHTDSDALLHVPADRIIFTADLLVTNNHPALSSGHPRAWLGILAKIKALEPVCLVPGHGPLGTLADVALIERYLDETWRMAEQNWRAGGSAASAAALPPPAFTAGWEYAHGFGLNMTFLHQAVQHA